MTITTDDLARALERKRRLGRDASYRRIAARAGISTTTIRRVLMNEPTAMPVDRSKVVREVNRAMDEIEAEERDGTGNGAGLVTAEPIP